MDIKLYIIQAIIYGCALTSFGRFCVDAKMCSVCPPQRLVLVEVIETGVKFRKI